MQASPIGSEHRDGAISVVPETDAIVAVCLEGDFDLTNAQALGEQLDRALGSGNGVIVDLSEATFVDSSVIHVLVRGAKAARRSDSTTGPEPGPPPPCGVENVLCRLMCMQSTPRSPGRTRPTIAL